MNDIASIKNIKAGGQSHIVRTDHPIWLRFESRAQPRTSHNGTIEMAQATTLTRHIYQRNTTHAVGQGGTFPCQTTQQFHPTTLTIAQIMLHVLGSRG